MSVDCQIGAISTLQAASLQGQSRTNLTINNHLSRYPKFGSELVNQHSTRESFFRLAALEMSNEGNETCR